MRLSAGVSWTWFQVDWGAQNAERTNQEEGMDMPRDISRCTSATFWTVEVIARKRRVIERLENEIEYRKWGAITPILGR